MKAWMREDFELDNLRLVNVSGNTKFSEHCKQAGSA
jgi:hypothetical protein